MILQSVLVVEICYRIFIYISVTFMVLAATTFMVNKDYHSIEEMNNFIYHQW